MTFPSHRLTRFGVAALLYGTPFFAAAAQRGAPDPNAPQPSQPVRFEFLGPASGGRFASIAGIQGDTSTWYLGSASGGVWKTTDGGNTFRPVFDDQPVQSIGAIAVAASDKNVVWAGTGEAWAVRESDIMGDGVYKSTDAGTTWTKMGLPETGRIARIIIHPTNAELVYVCALGRATGPQQERGVFRTSDGGKTWTRVLNVDANTGCSSLSIDAKDPNTLFAGMWQVDIKPWGMNSGGPGSSIWKSTDGGTKWTRIAHPGLPKMPIGKIGVAIAPTNSNRVYALIQTLDQGSLWRSDDAGASWKVVSWQRSLIGRAGYYMHLMVGAGSEDEVLVANSSFWRSTDGGKTFTETTWGGDNHDIWIDVKDPNHIGVTHDLGASLLWGPRRTVKRVALPNGQMYHIAIDQQVPYWVYSNRQDNGTMRGPSDGIEQGTPGLGNRFDFFGPPEETPADSATRRATLDSLRRVGGDTTAMRPRTPPFWGGSNSPQREWEHGIGGCESGFTIPDPNEPDIIWASCYGNKLTRFDHRTGTARSVAPWRITLDSPPDDVKYRCHWTAPLAVDPFDTKTVYYGCQVVFKTNNGGQSWTEISPDLSTKDPSRIKASGGVIGDNLGQFYGEVVFAIAPSKVQKGLIWVGTNDGLVWNTQDGGATWTNVTKNITGIPVWGTVREIEPSTFDAGTAYVVVDGHTNDDRKPYLFKTTDFGKTWKSIVGDLPNAHPLDYVLSVGENPNRKGMLFAGTGHAFYYSLDDGAKWSKFQTGLPAAPVTWIEVPKDFNDVVLSTYGRGLWILRDVGLFAEGASPNGTASETKLFAPHPGVRSAREGRADITFQVAKAGKVSLEITDASGKAVRTLPVTAKAGLNRSRWNLRYDLATPVELRTVAPDNPYIWDEPRFKGKNTRPIAHWGIQEPQQEGPIAAPGRYAVRLVVDGKPTPTQPLVILKDSRIPTSEDDLVASTQTQVRVRDRLTETANVVNRIEVLRKNIEDQVKENAGKPGVLKALADIDKKMLDVELILLSRHDLHSDDKWFVETYKTYLSLLWLAGEIGTGAGDVAGGADYKPTETSLRTLGELEKDLDRAKAAFKVLIDKELPAFNAAMAALLKPIA